MKEKLLVIVLIVVAISFSGCASIPSIYIPGIWGSPAITPHPAMEAYDAIITNDTILEKMLPGKAYTVSITMRNTGNLSWSDTNPVTLTPYDTDSNDAILFNNMTFTLEPGAIVRTGSDYTWNFTMVAPKWDGNYTIMYRMSSADNTSFGSTLKRNITVGDMNSTVVFLNGKIDYYPTFANMRIKNGSLQNVSITVKNMGRYGWSDANQVRLATVDYEPNNATLFNPTLLFYVGPDVVVNPGDQCIWKFKLHAPSSPGTYKLEYQMRQGDNWLGKPLIVYITVT